MSEDPEPYMDMMAGEMMDEEAAPMMGADMEAGERKIYKGRVKLIDDMDLYIQSMKKYEGTEDPNEKYYGYYEAKAPFCGQEAFVVNIPEDNLATLVFDDAIYKEYTFPFESI
jgi:hypothetical protein